MVFRICCCCSKRDEMAIIIEGKSCCSICGNVLQKDDDIIGFTAFLGPEHRFWKYSDSGMHKSCFENWEHRAEFLHLYNYKPNMDFNDPEVRRMAEKNGMPDWMKKIQAYRKKNPL